jgi:PAS domain S-box-containing protein
MAKKNTKTESALLHIDAIADRVAVIDLSGKIIDVNQAMLNFQQRRREEIVGRNFLDLVASEDRERIQKCFKETLQRGASNTIEYRSLTPAGTETFSEVNAMLQYDQEGKPIGAVAVIRDISQRREIERKLAESEEMYRSLLDNISEAVYQVGADGIIAFISAGIERIIGLQPDEVIGRNFMEFIYPEDVEFIGNEFQKVARNILGPSEYRVVHKSGEIRWISSSSRPIFRDGRFCGINGVLIDIHERKSAQLALQNQQELLQQAQKMEAIGTLASGIAHDFNNLLMGIQGRASLLLMESEAGRPDYEHLKGIEGYIKSAAELTQQLLGLARGGKYEVVPTDLNALIGASVEMFGRTGWRRS